MPKLKVLSGKDVVKIFSRFGFAHGIPTYVIWRSITYSVTYFIIGFFDECF